MALKLMKLTSKVLLVTPNSSSLVARGCSPSGILDNRSAHLFCILGIYSIWQLYPEMPKAHSLILLFFIGASSIFQWFVVRPDDKSKIMQVMVQFLQGKVNSKSFFRSCRPARLGVAQLVGSVVDRFFVRYYWYDFPFFIIRSLDQTCSYC